MAALLMNLSLYVAIIVLVFEKSVIAEASVPAMFVFGDSLMDPGNNNRLVTLAKANYFPNGIDFPGGVVTGRFCNGRTVADYLGNYLGLPLLPPFNNPNTTGPNILKGVNYASAASGILDDTGKLYGNLFPMDEQVQNFNKTVQQLKPLMGDATNDFLSRSLIFAAMGNNDYINNYLLPFSDKPTKYGADGFSTLLVESYSRQLTDLYNLGGRKFFIASLPPLGCIPNQIGNSQNRSSPCVDHTNALVLQFNTKLKAKLDGLRENLPGAYFLYWDVYDSTMGIINNYSAYGFKYANRACCGAGRSKGQIICLPVLPLECKNRTEFIFWDPYHSTDTFNAIAAKQAYQGTLQSTYPMNVQQFVQI